MEISKKKFDSLSPEEQAILQKLGVEVREPKNPNAGKEIVQQFVYIVESHCKLCSATTTSSFIMEGTAGLLMSKEISISEIPTDLPVKPRRETTKVCAQCRTLLKLRSHEDLIEMLIKSAKGDL